MALEKYYREDHTDLRRLKEECINHRIAMYIQENFLATPSHELCEPAEKIKSGKIKVDVEYDKAADQQKTIEGKSSRPDILIHHRGDNTDNFAFFELKKNYRSERDSEKCRGAKCSPYSYTHVLIIDCLIKEIESVRIIEFLANGSEKIHKYANRSSHYQP